jgi:methylmalonyl-CoA/ethylmalonyl-CoA epimerase
MKIEQVDHIHFAVKDIGKARKFFESLFNVKFSKEFILEEFKAKSCVATLGFVGIELVQATSPDSEIAKFIERKGEGVQAISLKVSNIDEAAAEAKAKGIRIVANVDLPKIREVELHPKDIFGIQIELCEYEMRHPAESALFYDA